MRLRMPASRQGAICSDKAALLTAHHSSHPGTEPPTTKTNLIRALYRSRDRSTRRSAHRGIARRSSLVSVWCDPRSRSDPDRPAPVPGREECEAVAIIAGHRLDAFVRETKARVLQRAHHAPRSLFIRYSREEGDEVRRDVHVDQPLCDEIEVLVDRVLLVPELLVHRTGRPLRALLE